MRAGMPTLACLPSRPSLTARVRCAARQETERFGSHSYQHPIRPMPRISLPLICTASALLPAAFASAQATMTPLSTFGTNGWIAPGGANPYVTTGNTERGLSYNPTTNNVVLVARQNVGGISNNVVLIDGANGTVSGTLDNTGLAGGTFLANMVDVAADGSIYVCNLSTSATSNFKVYKWNDETPAVPPTVAYDNLTGVARTGDAFAVTGGGANPVIFAAAGSNNVSASNFVVGTVDSTNTSTAYLSVAGTTTTSNDYRLGLTFVDQDTLIGNQGATARLTSFDPLTATVDASMPLGGAARRALDYAVIGGRPVLAVIDSNSSTVTVFDVTDPSNPVAIVSGNNTTGALTANANGTGGVAWGAISGNTATLYAMATNQGVQAFVVDLSPIASAVAFGSGCDGLGLVANGVPAIGNLGFELAVTGSVAPLAFVAFGTMAIDPGIPLASIGMPGCNAHQNLDLGLFATGPVVGGIGVFALPIPLTPSLANSSVAAQGVGLLASTPSGLSASNGVQVIVGF